MNNEEPKIEQGAGGSSGASCYVILTASERKQIVEVLERRANDIATFKYDLEQKISATTSQKIQLQDLPGSVEMALSREMRRLRKLADKLKPEEIAEDEE